MKSIWKGVITFGMVSVPSKLYSATEDRKIKLHNYHAECKTPLSMPKFCTTCAHKVTDDEVVKGYETGEGFVPLTEQDLTSLPVKSLKSVEVLLFVDPKDFDPRIVEKSYFLGADDGGNKAYTLLIKAMEIANLAAVAKLCYREREHLALMRPYQGIILLQTLFYANELRPVDGSIRPKAVQLSDKEMELAKMLVKSMTGSFEHAKYEDEYQTALQRLIEARIAGVILPAAPVEEKAPVSDVVDALLASLKQQGISA